MPALGSVRTGFFQSVVGFAGTNRPDTGWGTRRLPHPISPKPRRPLKTHVGPSRRAGDAYGGRGRNCQGNGPFGAYDRLVRGERCQTFQFAPTGQFAHIKRQQRASHERARQPCLRQDERSRQRDRGGRHAWADGSDQRGRGARRRAAQRRALRPADDAACAAHARHRCLCPHLQQRRLGSGRLRQRHALHRRAACSRKPARAH